MSYYVFMPKDSNKVYGYTKDKDIAKDFYDINSWRFRMLKFSKEEISEGINLPNGGNIDYHVLIGENKERYTIPLTDNEINEILNRCVQICTRVAYAKKELVSNNKYGLKKKYLNVINELTSVLKMRDLSEIHTDITNNNYSSINTLKIYSDLCNSKFEVQ